jgi:hypothetical protein
MQDDLMEFLGTNNIIDLELNDMDLEQDLPNSIYQSLRSFKFDNIYFNYNLYMFEKLQILGVTVALEELNDVIPFLAFKFTCSFDIFERMQINLFASDDPVLRIGDERDEYVEPKHI